MGSARSGNRVCTIVPAVLLVTGNVCADDDKVKPLVRQSLGSVCERFLHGAGVSEIPIEAAGKLIEESAARFTRREQGLVILGALLALALFWLAGHQFKIPTERHFSASLFQQPTAFTTIVVVG